MTAEIVVVGAGAAGIAAARRLHDRGRSVLLVEAMERVGGRAHTVNVKNLPLDLGCGWLHSAERNPLARLAEMMGHGRPFAGRVAGSIAQSGLLRSRSTRSRARL